MTTAKDTLDQYNETRSEWRENFQQLIDEKDKKRTDLKELLGDNPETMKNFKLESENYKIDKWKSKEEKLAEWWREEECSADIYRHETKIKVLKKELSPGAFVREYQDDGEMPKYLVGEQLFNWNAVLILGLQDRLPTWQNMITMVGKTQQEKDTFLTNNFQKGRNTIFPGLWFPNDKAFSNIGKRIHCRLSDGNLVGIKENDMVYTKDTSEWGSSLRLLKK